MERNIVEGFELMSLTLKTRYETPNKHIIITIIVIISVTPLDVSRLNM